MPDEPRRRPRTAREETAERLQNELARPFRHSHDYSPDVVGMGRTRIPPGSPVQQLSEHNRQMNSGVRGWSRRFTTVRDAEGNMGVIARGELTPRNTYRARAEQASERGFDQYRSPSARALRRVTEGAPAAWTPGRGWGPARPVHAPPAELDSPDAMRWSPEEGENEISAWRDIFHDRRGE